MSGIYIKGIECPKPKLADMATVYDAYILVSPNGHAAIVVDNEDGLDSTEYPLIPVPDHGDLIDRGYAIATACSGLITTEDGERWIRVEEVRESIKAAPTIIPADK